MLGIRAVAIRLRAIVPDSAAVHFVALTTGRADGLAKEGLQAGYGGSNDDNVELDNDPNEEDRRVPREIVAEAEVLQLVSLHDGGDHSNDGQAKEDGEGDLEAGLHLDVPEDPGGHDC